MDAEEFCAALQKLTVDQKQFLGGSEELVKASISIFARLPMARQAVIEYYSHHVFERAVADYMSDTIKNPNAMEEDYNVLINIQQGLTNLVFEHPDEFASPISIWSIQLLGKLSQKYDRSVDNSSNNKRWLECDAVRALLSLAAIGFWKTEESEEEYLKNDCINVLIETYMKYSPAADWIVARLASSYILPLTTKVLFNGLHIYQKNSINGNNIQPIVLILEQLVDKHFSNLDCAFKKLIQWSLNKTTRNNLRHHVIPYILRLGLSEQLLPFVYKTLLQILTLPDTHATILALQRHHSWMCLDLKYTTLIVRMAEMTLKIDREPFKVMSDLLKKSDDCSFTLHVVMEMLNEAGKGFRKTNKHYPLIIALTEDDNYKYLCKFMICANSNGLKSSLMLRLLNYLSNNKPILFTKIVHYLLYHITSINKLGLLLQFTQAFYLTGTNVNNSCLFEALQMTFTSPRQSDFDYTFFWENLCNLINQEKKGTSVFLKQAKFTKAATQNLFHMLKFLEEILDNKLEKVNKHVTNEENHIIQTAYCAVPKSELQNFHKNVSKIVEAPSNAGSIKYSKSSICDNIAKILELLDINRGVNCIIVNNEVYRKLIDVIVKYFFYSLLLKRSSRRRSSIIALRLLNKCCSSNRIGRIISTQLLVDGAVFKYSLLFGATAPVYKYETQAVSLFDLNIKQGFTSQMSQRHLAVFRNEMDLNNRKKQSLITETCYQRQRLLLEALSASMSEKVLSGPSTDALTSLSLWLVESVSTDVMYNGLPWPDEEFTKITMERDLHIRRMFLTTPVLWSLLRFVAVHRPALCYCSVLLRALTSVLIYQWLSWSNKSTPDSISHELHATTKNVLEILSLGQLLPPPLDSLAVVVPNLSAVEISVVLRDCVWFYMKENVPAPVLFQENQLGHYWRDPEISHAPMRFVESLRTVMQKHLPDLASSYNQIFIQCYK